MSQRRYSLVDRLIQNADNALRSVTPGVAKESRPSPAVPFERPALSDKDQRHVAGLMRINHTGEVCAQALYQGQAMTAKLEDVRESMEQAAKEEIDHLAWCEQRVNELNSHTSYLNPAWYGLSFLIGASAGLIGDRWSLGFVAETERQVCAHLESHLEQVPRTDKRTRAILKQMKIDEEKHGTLALESGGSDLPRPIQALMSVISKVMTITTYRI